MKRLYLIFVFCLSIFVNYSQNYTWMHGGGGSSGAVAGLYGTQGIPSSINNPGSRHGCANWTDASGNLWLFGGEGNDINNSYGWLNDLWKYTVSTNEWTWISGSTFTNQPGVYGTQGTAAGSNSPGAREFSVSWVDAAGNFWMFGGDGYASTPSFGRLGDLWKFNPNTLQWTWVHGYNTVNQNGVYGTMGTAATANKPGSRYGGTTWADASGKLWLFGGKGFDAAGSSNYLNDLWCYDIITNQWTWINGSTIINQFGTYGTLSTPALSNHPGSREFPVSWVSASGTVYLFGGWGYATGTTGYLSDLWKYDAILNTWTWLNGASAPNQTGTYGTQGVASSLNMPGGRLSPAAWKDDTGNLWLFGGDGFSSAGPGQLNDLFKYNYCSNQWTWVKGDNIADQSAVYGVMGVSNSANTPGGRQYNTFWKGQHNTLWLFGGIGYGTGTFSGNNTDLWKFDPPCFHTNINTSNYICSANTLTLSLPNICEGQILWYTSPTGTNSIGSGNSYTTMLSAGIHTIYAEAASCTVSPRGAAVVTVDISPTLTLTPASLCEGSVTTLTVSGAVSYTWDASIYTSTLSVFPIAPSYDFTLQGTGNNGCKSTVINSVAVYALPNVSISATNPLALCLNQPTTLTATGASSYLWNNGSIAPVITVTPATLNTNYTVTGTDSFGCVNVALVQQPVTTPPALTIISSGVLCSGTANTLTASGADFYLWSPGATTSVVIITPAVPAFNFTLQGTDVNGCTSDSIGSWVVNVSPTLSVSSSQPIELCQHTTATLTATGSAGNYSWSNGINGNTATVSPMQTSSYTITVTNSLVCQASAVITQSVVICNGIRNNGTGNKLVTLYPNPNTGDFTLIIEEENSVMQLVIFTTLGQKIAEQTLKKGANYISSGLAKGVYYYKVESAGNTVGAGRLLVD